MNSSILQINKKPKTKHEVGLPKIAVDTAEVTLSGIVGDFNRFRSTKKRNNPEMGLMLLTTDILDELNREGWPIKPGDLGENITLTDIDYQSLAPKQKYEIGSIQIEISFICAPCSNLGVLPYVGKEKIKDFMKILLNRRGWYARVLKAGMICKGDAIKKF